MDTTDILSSAEGWEDLDTSLCAISSIQRVHVVIASTGNTLSDTMMQTKMRLHLPLLEARRILSLEGGNVEDVESATWSRAVNLTP
jgi:hypothetical protein